MTATATEKPQVTSFRSRASSLQQMLDLEKQYKLERLHNIDPNVAQSKVPRAALQPRHPLQARRAEALSQQKHIMPHAIRQNVELPSLSISIPSRNGGGKDKADVPTVSASEKEDDNDTENGKRDEDGNGKEDGYENSNEVDGAIRKSVKFLAPDDGDMSEESSICQSPSWEGYGRKKQQKKDVAKKRKKEKNQAERETKTAKKRLSKAPPVSMQRQSSRSSTPVPLNERSLSAPLLGSHQELSGRGSRASSIQDKETARDDTYQVTITSASGTSLANGTSHSKVGRLFGGRKGDQSKRSTGTKATEMVTFIPLSYAVMGNIGIGMVPRPRMQRPQSMGPSGPSPSAQAASENKNSRDSCPPSASRTYTLLNPSGALYSRSSSITSGTAVTEPEASSSGWRDMNSTTGSQSSAGAKTSQDSGQSAAPTVERGRRESRGYVRHSRDQSTERAISGLMDQQLVASANSGSRPRRLSLAAEVRAVLRAGFGSSTKSSSGTATPMEKEAELELKSDKSERWGEEDQAGRDARRRKVNGQEHDGQPKIRAQTSLDDTVSDYWRFLDESYTPPTLDLLSPTGNLPPSMINGIAQTPSGSTATLYYSATSKSELNLQDAADAMARVTTAAKKTSQDVENTSPSSSSTQVNSVAHQDERAANSAGAAANSFRGNEKSTHLVSSSNVKLAPEVGGTFTDTPNKPRMRPARASSQELSASSKAWNAPERARPSHKATARSPSAQAYSSATAVNVSQRYPEIPSRRASSSLGFEQPNDRLRVPAKIGRIREEFSAPAARQVNGIIANPLEGSSSSSTYDDASPPPSPVTTPDNSRPQSLRGNSSTLSTAVKVRKVASTTGEDGQNEDVLPVQAQKSECASDEHFRQRCDSAASRSGLRTPLDESWSRSALPIDIDSQSIRSSFANRDGRISRSSLINVEIPLPEMEVPRETDEEGLANLDLSTSSSGLRESLSNPDLMERVCTPDLRRQTERQQVVRERSSASSPDQTASAKLLSDNSQASPSRFRTSVASSANSFVSLASSVSTSSAAYLQEARKTAPASSRTSITTRPPHTGAPANVPRSNLVAKNLPPHGITTKVPASSDLQRPIAKMFVECCNCHFYHDLPSRLYQCMATPDSIVEDKLLGVSGAITTMVKCPWCAHNMSTKCCAGYAAVVYLKEKLH